MEYRFIIHGGWERSIKVDHREGRAYPPDAWRIIDLPQGPASFTDYLGRSPDAYNAAACAERIFERREWRHPSDPLMCEFFYTEPGLHSEYITGHTCAGLKRANERLREAARVCELALDIIETNEHTFAASAFMCGGSPIAEIDRIAKVKSELASIVLAVRGSR